jgi:tight adherence protein B
MNLARLAARVPSLLPLFLKWAAVGTCAAGLGVLGFALLADAESPLHRAWARYCSYLDTKLYRLFVFQPGSRIAAGQMVALIGIACAGAVGKTKPAVYVAAGVAVAAGPALVLARRLCARVLAIDGQVEAFVVAAANALKSRPAVGDAMASVVSLTPNPLRQELEVAVKQMRLGSTAEQALLHMSARIGSKPLDTAVSALLIGRQVGGHLPTILETTAAAMREMARLEGVVRTKTAEGKAQIYVLAFFPCVLLFAFNVVSPGFFDPLTDSFAGTVAMVVAFAFWAASFVLARRILAVDI